MEEGVRERLGETGGDREEGEREDELLTMQSENNNKNKLALAKTRKQPATSLTKGFNYRQLTPQDNGYIIWYIHLL